MGGCTGMVGLGRERAATTAPPPNAEPLPEVRPDATTLTRRGDWNDVHAAVLVGVEAAEAVVESRAGDGPPPRPPRRWVYSLRRATGQGGVLTVERTGDPEENTTLTLRCSIGPFGKPALERALLDAVAVRLEALRGVEWAPLK